MIKIEGQNLFLNGPKGSIPVRADDEITPKLVMLFEGECEGLGATKAAQKFGYTRQRYHQLFQLYKSQGASALQSKKRGPRGNYRRTDEVVRQIIRYRFLDPEVSPEVITQKLVQSGFSIAVRSVKRVISEFGLQKKTPSMQSGKSSGRD